MMPLGNQRGYSSIAEISSKHRSSEAGVVAPAVAYSCFID